MPTAQQPTDESAHIAEARRWLLKRHKIEGPGLVPAERVASLARMIRRRFEKVFDLEWCQNVAWTVLHETEPAMVAGGMRETSHGSLLAFEFAIERAEHGVTLNPEILACDRRTDELHLRTLEPAAQSERARADYLTTCNRIEAGQRVRGDQAAERFRSAGILVNREIRNIGRRIGNQAATLDDHGELTELIFGEVRRIRQELARELKS